MFTLGISLFYLLIVGIVTLAALPLGLFIGLFSKSARDHYSLGFVKIVLSGFLFTTGTKVVYKGLENLPKKGDPPVCYIGNHTGIFDIIACYPKVHDLTGFIAKKEMENWPIIGWWMPYVHCLFLDRKDHKKGIKTILDGIKNIENGISMYIFPEGTRSKKEGELLRFHKGSFKMATKNRTTIIPVVNNNAGAVFESSLPHLKPTTMSIEFLEPIELKDMSEEELSELPEKIQRLIWEHVIINGKEIGSIPESAQLPETING